MVKEKVPRKQKTLHIVLTTFNAQSLLDEDASFVRDNLPRAELLRNQLASVHLVGIQEARTPERTRRCPGWFIIATGSAKNRSNASIGGIELWVNTELPITIDGEQELRLNPNHFTIAHASDRLLVVNLDAPFLMLRILVGHGPSFEKRNKELDATRLADIRKWWDTAAGFLPATRDTRDAIMLLDANARLGTVISHAVGGKGHAEQENPTGSIFHKFLLDNGFAVPSTLVDNDNPAQHTWTSPQGTMHRIDYVVLPKHWIPSVSACRALDDIELLAKGTDHRPTMVTVTVSTQPTSSTRQWQAFRPEYRSLQDKEARLIFVRELRASPPIPWSTPIDEHYNLVVE